MDDAENKSGIICRASDSEVSVNEMPDNTDMSRDLPMQNAINVVSSSMRSAEKKHKKLIDDSKLFTKTLRTELLKRDLISEDDDRNSLRSFFGLVSQFSEETFLKLRGESPSYRLLFDELKILVRRICTGMQRSLEYSEEDYSDLADNLMQYVWPHPIRPYIKNMLLRETAIQSVDLVELWHSAAETEELTKEEASEQLEYCAVKANSVSKLFTKDHSVYFCEDIEKTNKLDELQEMWLAEEGDTVKSWERKHGAFVKASLMYAIHMIDGTICRKETNMVMKEIKRRIEAVSIDLGGDAILLNPTEEGQIGPNSLKLNKIDYNSKDPESEYLKFITKLLSDNIAPDAHTTADRHRFRGYLLEDPRESHPSLNNCTVEVAEIAAATKFLAIVMMRFGTTVDKRTVRNSINTGEGINEKSGRVHRALQWKGSIFVDKTPHGNLREKSKGYMYEGQALCHVLEYEADIAEYRRKKILKAQAVLGVGINFAADTLNHCDVFNNHYSFSNDSPGMRELAETTFGKKMLRTPFLKEMVAKKLLDRLVSEDVETQRIVRKLFKRRSAGKKLKKALDEIGKYLTGLKKHYLIMRSLNIFCIISNSVHDKRFVEKARLLNKYLSDGQLVETDDLYARIAELKQVFEDYASQNELKKYDEKTYSYIKELLDDLDFVANKGPSGLDAKLKLAKQMHVKKATEGEATEVPPIHLDQLSLFPEDPET